MDINQAKIFVEYLARMNQTGNIGPDGFNILALQAQEKVMNDLIGQIMNYAPNRSMKPGEAIAPISAEVTSVVTDMLSPIKKQVVFTNSTGLITLPDDYLYLSNLETLYLESQSNQYTQDGYNNWVQVDDIVESEKAYRLNSHVKYPTVKAPAAVAYNGYWQVYPNPTTDKIYPQQIRLTYYQNPPAPVWAYTGTGDNIVYDPGASTNFSLGVGAHQRICWEILRMFALSMRDLTLLQFCSNQLNEGV